MNKKNKTVRECNNCKYRSFIYDDNLEERKCRRCDGLLKIIKINKNK